MASRDYFTNTISYSDWDYHKKMRKNLSYDSQKPFSGSYDSGGGSYAFSSPKSSSGSYKALDFYHVCDVE